MLKSKEQYLLNALEPVAQAHGVEIVTVEILSTKKSHTVSVYIDVEGGVSFDELSKAQEWVNEVIDKLDPFPNAYILEVSSPGIDRPLRTSEHFARFIGSTAVVKMATAVNERTSFTGEIVAVENDCAQLKLEGGEIVVLPVQNMKKANIKGVIDFSR